MTYQTTAVDAFSARIPGSGLVPATTPFMTAGRAFSQVSAWFSRVNTRLMENSSGAARVNTVRALQAKSDAELARMGISRDEIVHHVFRDIYFL